MFDFDVGKLLIFGIVALAVIPPKDLPRVMRTVGQTIGKMRRMAAEFQGQFMDAMKEADLESVKQDLENVKKELSALEESAKVNASFDPAMAMRQEVTHAVEGPKEVGHSEVALSETPANEAAPVIAAPVIEMGEVDDVGMAPSEAAPVPLDETAPPALHEAAPIAAESVRAEERVAASEPIALHDEAHIARGAAE